MDIDDTQEIPVPLSARTKYALGCGSLLIVTAIFLFVVVKFKYEFINQAVVEQHGYNDWMIYMNGEKDWVDTGISIVSGDTLLIHSQGPVLIYTGGWFRGESNYVEGEALFGNNISGTIYIKESAKAAHTVYVSGYTVEIKKGHVEK